MYAIKVNNKNQKAAFSSDGNYQDSFRSGRSTDHLNIYSEADMIQQLLPNSYFECGFHSL